ncbi:hypothetical protein Tco_0615628 [Tanacetum coccineum]
MSNMSEDIQCAGFDTRPSMLDRSDFESWQQRIRLYCQGKDNRENIIKSIDEGPFQIGTFRETLAEGAEGALNLGPEQDRVFSDLTLEEMERFKADIRATNILLQGLPKYIYKLINHYTDAKDIWDNVKMLLEGSELTKDDRESQIYDDFEQLRQNKGETIHAYYVRFTKLMTMPKMQLNSKFVNNMLPEWSRFVTEVKLKRGLRESNFDQLYAYLKQHEVHANENKIMLDRFIQPTNDSLALVSNASIQQNPPQSSVTSSNTRNKATVQDGRVVVQDVRGRYNTNNQGRPFQRNNARGVVGTGNAGARECPQPRQPQDSDYFKDKMLLMQAQKNSVVLDEEQLLFLAGEHVTNFDEDVDDLPEQDLALNVDHVFEADQYDAFDSDVDEYPTTQTMFMANLSSEDLICDEAGTSYDSDVPSEVQDHDNYQDSVNEHHEVQEMQNNVQQDYVVDFDAEYTSDTNIIPYDQYVDNAGQVVQSNVSSVQNDALMMIIDDMHEQVALSVLENKQNKVVNESLTSELARYKELAEMYEKGKSLN